MCYIEPTVYELQKEIKSLKEKFIIEKIKWKEEKINLEEIIEEIKSCLFIGEKNPDDFDGEASIFYDN